MGLIEKTIRAIPSQQKARAKANLLTATSYLSDQCRLSVARPGSPGTHAPRGQPPFRQTGKGRESIFGVIDPATMTGSVGTRLNYMARLEKTHPWLAPTVARCLSRVRAMLRKK